MEIRQIAAGRILSPTRIPLGDYVINPYKGCFFDCAYCYERKSLRLRSETRHWGQYVDARINAVLRLEREIMLRRPSRVLIGSTSDCFQPLEARLHLTSKIIRVLNSHRIRYNIITRSPLIARYGHELDPELCETVLFTVNSFPEPLARLIEPHSADIGARFSAITSLRGRGLHVKPAFAPFMPGLSRPDDVFARMPRGSRMRAEGLNFNVGNIGAVIRAIGSVDARMGSVYARMKTDADYYARVWKDAATKLRRRAASYAIKLDVDVHGLNAGASAAFRDAPQPAAPAPASAAATRQPAPGENYELF